MNASRHRSGFTLLELVVVIAIISCVATVVAISTRGTIQSTRVRAAATQLQSIDHLLREVSTSEATARTLTFELPTGRVSSSDGRVSRRFPVARVLVVGARSGDAEVVQIPFRTDGASASYAVGLGPADQPTRWVVFAGGSGQVIELEREEDARELLQLGT